MKSYSLFEVWQKIILLVCEYTSIAICGRNGEEKNKDSSLKVKFLKIWGIIFLL